MKTPWGYSDFETVIVDGVVLYETPSHGGIRLSKERQAKLPKDARKHNGWYEEDCDAAIPLLVFFEEVKQVRPWLKRENLCRIVLRWSPRAFEALEKAGLVSVSDRHETPVQ